MKTLNAAGSQQRSLGEKMDDQAQKATTLELDKCGEEKSVPYDKGKQFGGGGSGGLPTRYVPLSAHHSAQVVATERCATGMQRCYLVRATPAK